MEHLDYVGVLFYFVAFLFFTYACHKIDIDEYKGYSVLPFFIIAFIGFVNSNTVATTLPLGALKSFMLNISHVLMKKKWKIPSI